MLPSKLFINANSGTVAKKNGLTIISGGQTGVDRAALDAAISLGLNYGGWCPKGRTDELGKIPGTYEKLIEVSGEFANDKDNRAARTKKNIHDSDGTLIISPKIPMPDNIQDGTRIMEGEAKTQGKPYLNIDLSKPIDINSELITNWVLANKISTLNIGGPCESSWPGIYESSLKLFMSALSQCKNITTLDSNDITRNA